MEYLEEIAGWDQAGSESKKFKVRHRRNTLDGCQGILETVVCSVDQLALPRGR